MPATAARSARCSSGSAKSTRPIPDCDSPFTSDLSAWMPHWLDDRAGNIAPSRSPGRSGTAGPAARSGPEGTDPGGRRRARGPAQRHYIEEWVHLLAPLRPDLADGEVRLAVHAAIGAIQSTLFFRSGLADERLTELLEGMAHGCLGTDPVPVSELALTMYLR